MLNPTGPKKSQQLTIPATLARNGNPPATATTNKANSTATSAPSSAKPVGMRYVSQKGSTPPHFPHTHGLCSLRILMQCARRVHCARNVVPYERVHPNPIRCCTVAVDKLQALLACLAHSVSGVSICEGSDAGQKGPNAVSMLVSKHTVLPSVPARTYEAARLRSALSTDRQPARTRPGAQARATTTAMLTAQARSTEASRAARRRATTWAPRMCFHPLKNLRAKWFP